MGGKKPSKMGGKHDCLVGIRPDMDSALSQVWMQKISAVQRPEHRKVGTMTGDRMGCLGFLAWYVRERCQELRLCSALAKNGERGPSMKELFGHRISSISSS